MTSPAEYKAQTKVMEEKLEKRCKEEGIVYAKVQDTFLSIQHGPDWTFYRLGHELYGLFHDGDAPRWQYIGNI